MSGRWVLFGFRDWGHSVGPDGLLWNLIKSRATSLGRPSVKLQKPAKPVLADDLAGVLRQQINEPMLVFPSFFGGFVFCLQVLYHILLVTVDPSGQHHQKYCVP